MTKEEFKDIVQKGKEFDEEGLIRDYVYERKGKRISHLEYAGIRQCFPSCIQDIMEYYSDKFNISLYVVTD